MSDKKKAAQAKGREMNPHSLRIALTNKLNRRIEANGELSFPATPGMLEHYLKTLNTFFGLIARSFTDDELGRLREILGRRLTAAYEESVHSRVVVKYQTELPPHPGIAYTVSTLSLTIADEYERWVNTREAPLFGSHADTRILHAAAELGQPADVPVLDVGAGTGRNTLPLARAGYPTDACELAPALANELRKAIEAEKLPVSVFEGDVLDEGLGLPLGKYKLVALAEVVASHFTRVEQVRALAKRVADLLQPGGVFLFNAFIATGGFVPDKAVREVSHVSWCCVFTRKEMDEAMEGLPFARVADESVHDFELAHLPKEAWPPTGWFVNWAQGSDLFALPAGRAPVELRWLSYKRV